MVTDLPPQLQGGGFVRSLQSSARRRGTWLCVGLDPDLERLPASVPRTAAGVSHFCREIIKATQHAAAAYKMNVAFFEALGADGWRALRDVREAVPAETPAIADAKRGDIGNTARAYAAALFGGLEFDAVTASPYLGMDSLTPFLSWPGRGVLVLCRTSNPGSSDLQELEVEGEPLYVKVARLVLGLGQPEAGLVVGATSPDALRCVRALDESVVLLVPGVGAQGAVPQEAMQAGANREGANCLINVSREIIFADGSAGYARAAELAAERVASEMAIGQGQRPG